MTKVKLLTVFDEAEHCAVLQTHIHVEILHVDVHVTHPALIVLTLRFEVFYHGSKPGDLVSILLDADRITSYTRHFSYTYADSSYLRFNVCDFLL